MRHNLSGLYIFDQLEGDEKPKPTCIEDCTVEARQKWLESLDRDGLIRVIDVLCETTYGIGEKFGIYAN